jgi:hypothetical protein
MKLCKLGKAVCMHILEPIAAGQLHSAGQHYSQMASGQVSTVGTLLPGRECGREMHPAVVAN